MSAGTQVKISVGDEGVLNVDAALSLSELWLDRDLGWMDFNERVLAEALDDRTPLLERAKFLAIFSSNLDEFFMKRMAVLRKEPSPAGLDLLGRIREKILAGLIRQAECFRHSIVPGLAAHGIHLRTWEELTPAQHAECAAYFDDQVSAALTPLVFDPAHPFPFLSNLSTSLVFVLHDQEENESMYARVKVPSVLKQWIRVKAGAEPGETVLVPLHELIRGNLHKLYRGMELKRVTLFRLTRDADVELDEDAEEELSELVKEQIRQRRYEPVVRLEFGPGADPAIRDMLAKRFDLHAFDVYDLTAEVDYTSLFEIGGLDRPDLRDVPWTPLPSPALMECHGDTFKAIRAGDVLLHHPYESFDASVEHFVSAAANDPHTVAIKMTAYRIGDDTPFVRSLINAAEAGKQVACVIEIKARFDEARNLHWAAELERAGAHVTFGVRGLKTHAKTILVIRKEASGLRAYVHIGTGNYHVRTARLYADVGLLTCDPVIGRDAIHLFHYLTGHGRAPEYAALLVAPATMRPRFLELVHREIQNKRAGLPARIIAKINQLEDPEMIESLCEAAQAGVPIDLIIRGFCCLRPGVPGRSEGIRIRSIIGRFLEHSRIFHFAAGQEQPLDGEFFIGSADWMVRNLSGRVEVVAPVTARASKERLWEILEICLHDQRQAWVLGSDGSYSQLRPEAGMEGRAEGPASMGTHQALMKLAQSRAID